MHIRIFLILLVSVVATLFQLGQFAPSSIAATFAGKVLSIVDGDTLNISCNGNKEKIILYGIDCPELTQDYGRQARQFTDDLCWSKIVTVEERGRDSHGRTIAIVYLPDGTNLNQELVRKGLAWWSDKYAPTDAELKQLHLAAKAAHAGLWAAPNPIPPWIFRNGQKTVQATIKSK